MEFVVEYDRDKRQLSLNGKPCRMVSTTRATGICGDFVVKMDKKSGDWNQTLIQTKNEIEFYKTLSNEDKELIPNILATGELEGKSWLVMERVDFEEFSDWPFPQEVQDYKARHPELWDIGAHNFGIKPNGKPVIYDFAL